MKVYVINLARHRRRLRDYKRSHKFLTNDIKVVRAVDGTKCKKTNPNFATKGQYGCFMSHLKVWRRVSRLKNENEWVIVTEDDARMSQVTKDKWKSSTKQWDSEKASVVILSWGRPVVDEQGKTWATKHHVTEKPIKLKKGENENFGGAYVYAMTPRGAKQLLGSVDKESGRPLDNEYANVGVSHVHCIDPHATYAKAYESTTAKYTKEMGYGLAIVLSLWFLIALLGLQMKFKFIKMKK